MSTINHIGIIMDGNRRWAKKRALKPWEGHNKGADVLEGLVEWCIDLKVKELTLFTFSTENFKRDEAEKKFLFELLDKACQKILKGHSGIEKNKVCVKFIGRLSMFPQKLQDSMDKVMDKTKNFKGFKLNFAMGYGGRSEIVDAVNEIIKNNIKSVNEESFKKFLYLQSEPDLIIRTGGVMRLSNFLTYQSVYSELIFLDKMWPDFSKEDLKNCIIEFENRERRFGK